MDDECILEFVTEALESAGASVERDSPKNDVPVGVLRVLMNGWQFELRPINVEAAG